MYLKEFRNVQHRYVSEVTNFDPFFGPSSDLYTRTQDINSTVVCMALKKDLSSITLMYKTV